MSSLLMFAAKGNPEVEGIGALLLIIVCVVTLIGYGVHAATHEYSVVTKRGVPYCRGCGRQVSYRRDHCRACGLSLYVPREPARPRLYSPEALAAERDRVAAEEWARRQAEEVARLARLP